MLRVSRRKIGKIEKEGESGEKGPQLVIPWRSVRQVKTSWKILRHEKGAVKVQAGMVSENSSTWLCEWGKRSEANVEKTLG